MFPSQQNIELDRIDVRTRKDGFTIEALPDSRIRPGENLLVSYKTPGSEWQSRRLTFMPQKDREMFVLTGERPTHIVIALEEKVQRATDPSKVPVTVVTQGTGFFSRAKVTQGTVSSQARDRRLPVRTDTVSTHWHNDVGHTFGTDPSDPLATLRTLQLIHHLTGSSASSDPYHGSGLPPAPVEADAPRTEEDRSGATDTIPADDRSPFDTSGATDALRHDAEPLQEPSGASGAQGENLGSFGSAAEERGGFGEATSEGGKEETSCSDPAVESTPVESADSSPAATEIEPAAY